MMSAMRKPKVDLTMEQKLIEKAIAEGRCTRQKQFSMKALGNPDKRLQPRVSHINVEHSKLLEGIRRVQGSIAPIVVFDDEARGKFYLASGWHRWHGHKSSKEESIDAYVIKGTWDEAMEFAAATNQDTRLPRNPEDVKKQIFMLLAMPKWLNSNDALIGRHVGVSGPTVKKYRAMYCDETGVPIPVAFVREDGQIARTPLSSGRPRITQVAKSGGYVAYKAKIKGHEVQLGSSRNGGYAAAEAKLGLLLESKDRFRTNLSNPANFRLVLAKYRLAAYPTDKDQHHGQRYGRLAGFIVGDCLCVLCPDINKPSEVWGSVGKLVGLEGIVTRPFSRRVVVCYHEDALPGLIELFRSRGFEFMTPEELVASIKGEEAEEGQGGDSPASG